MKRFDFSILFRRLNSLGPLLLLLLAPLPLLYFLFLSHIQLKKLDRVEEKINVLHHNFVLAKLQNEKEDVYLSKLKKASPYYINEHLESLEFLKAERDRAALSETSLTRIPVQKLRLIEGAIRRAKGLQEVEENQERPILMSEDDLKKTLSLIEGVTLPPHQGAPNAPELVIKSIDLKKTSLSAYEHAFEVNMQLIKRERIQ